jgi:DNA-directed RNA polymerase
MRYISRIRRILPNPLTKSLRRQKEKRFERVAKNFFNDGSTQYGRERIDRSMKKMYGHNFLSMKTALPKKQLKNLVQKTTKKRSAVKTAVKNRRKEIIDSLTGNVKISKKASKGEWMTYKKGDIIPF